MLGHQHPSPARTPPKSTQKESMCGWKRQTYHFFSRQLIAQPLTRHNTHLTQAIPHAHTLLLLLLLLLLLSTCAAAQCPRQLWYSQQSSNASTTPHLFLFMTTHQHNQTLHPATVTASEAPSQASSGGQLVTTTDSLFVLNCHPVGHCSWLMGAAAVLSVAATVCLNHDQSSTRHTKHMHHTPNHIQLANTRSRCV